MTSGRGPGFGLRCLSDLSDAERAGTGENTNWPTPGWGVMMRAVAAKAAEKPVTSCMTTLTVVVLVNGIM